MTTTSHSRSRPCASPLDLSELLRSWLPSALAHELHHSKRILEGPGYGRNLLAAMMSEGAAEAFIRATYPNAPPIPWVQPLGRPEKELVLRRARSDLFSPDEASLHETWFVGAKGGLPRWSGYKLGYAIVEAYLHAHPSTTAADLALTPARTIFEQSGFPALIFGRQPPTARS